MTEFRADRRARRRFLAVATAGALVAVGALIAPTAASASETQISGVTLDWGVNLESSGGSYFGGCNFLSAGKAGNAGSSRLWTEADGFYKASDGNVQVVKPNASGTDVAPTWATKCQDASGAAVGVNATSSTTSRVTIGGGSGTVDLAAHTATIGWTGSWTFAYYGGLTYWSVSDPQLTVAADGTGALTATASGFGASMTETGTWEALPATTITLANLSDVAVSNSGFTVTPDYLGVATPSGLSTAQAEKSSANSAWWGSFPADFVQYQELTGQTSYWYTTAGDANSIQPRKVATPLTVGWDIAAPAITAQPADATATLGQTATFTVAASGSGVTYQWQRSTDGSAWTDITGATASSYSIAATTASAVSYRAVVTNDVTAVTSSAAKLTVNIPTPTVTVSKTTGLDPAGETVTVTGSGFLANPPATSGTRPPLAGTFTGSYVAFGAFAPVWKPSAGAASSARAADKDNTKWAVSAENIPAIGGASAGGIELKADGTFNTQLTVTKDFAGALANGNYGVYTYPGGGASYAPFETYTPITFAVARPAAPAKPTAALNDDATTIAVSWTASDASEQVSGYTVTLTPSTGTAQTRAVDGATTSVEFEALKPGVSYTATVVATNAGGSLADSTAASSVEVPAAAPAAPAAPAVSPSPTSATIGWTASESNGSAITGYTVTVSDASGVVATKRVDGDTLTAVIDGLTRTTDYTATVVATNAIGDSAASAATTFTTLAAAPSAPTSPTVNSVADKTATIVWTAPDNGGSPITGYTVAALAGGTQVATATATSTFAVVRNLTPKTTYTFTVTATSDAGSSAASEESAPATTYGAPDAATGVSAALEGANGVTATWLPGATNGGTGSGFTHFTQLVENGSVVDGSGRTLDPETLTVTYSGLAPGQKYAVEVLEQSIYGESDIIRSNEVTVPAVAPSAPAAPGVVRSGSDAVQVNWAAPSSDGGAAISTYLVTVFSGSQRVGSAEVAGDVTSATVAGLSAGTYTATVTAVNSAGQTESAASPSVVVVGPAPADDPQLLTDEQLANSELPDLPVTVTAGTAVIDLGTDHANQWIGVSVNSTPRFLGWFVSDANGAVAVTLPSDLAVGTHHLVAFDANGDPIGTFAFAVTVTDDGTTVGTGSVGTAGTSGSLASTGSTSALPYTIGAVLLLLAGAATMLIARRRRHARG